MSLAPCDPDSLGVYDEPEQPGLYPSVTMLDAISDSSLSLRLSASWYAGSSSPGASPMMPWGWPRSTSRSCTRSGNMAAMAAIVAGSGLSWPVGIVIVIGIGMVLAGMRWVGM